MKKELEIIKHVIELYTGDITEAAMANYELKNGERVKMYAEAFRDYDLSDVLQAIDEFWNFKSSKTKPTVAQILAILNSKKEVEKDRWANVDTYSAGNGKSWRDIAKTDLAEGLKMRGGNKNLRYWYTAAIREIFAERVGRLPESRFWDYGKTVAECFRRGFFDDVDEVAENIRQREASGKNITPVSTMEAAGKWLASHWATGGAG